METVMTDEVFKWVIAIAVLVVFISNLVVLWLFYAKVKPLIAQLQKTNKRVNTILEEAQPVVQSVLIKANQKLEPILNETHGIMSNVKNLIGAVTPIISENRPVVREITAKTNDRIGLILDEVHGIMGNVKSIIAENQPVVHDIATKANDITGKVNDQATEVRTLMQNTALPKVRDQIERLDNLVKRTTDSIDTSIMTMERQATRSIQETDSLGAILGVALGVFLRRGLSSILSSTSRSDERRQSG